MGEANIFSTLAKHGAYSENYLTEALVFVIGRLMKTDKQFGLAVLATICGERLFSDEDSVTIRTQVSVELGTPDIVMSAPSGKEVYVEVKDRAGLGDNQLPRYRDALETQNSPQRRLAVLSRYPVDPEQAASVDQEVFWWQVHSVLRQHTASDTVTQWLVEAFIFFLEDKGMAIQKVDWEYIRGVPAFLNLLGMLSKVAEEAGLKPWANSAQDYSGYSIELPSKGRRFWLGIMHDYHLEIALQWDDGKLGNL